MRRFGTILSVVLLVALAPAALAQDGTTSLMDRLVAAIYSLLPGDAAVPEIIIDGFREKPAPQSFGPEIIIDGSKGKPATESFGPEIIIDGAKGKKASESFGPEIIIDG